MLTKYAQTLNGTQIDERASQYFNALFTRTETTDVSVVPTFSSPEEGSFLLKLAVSGTVPTTFTKVLGQPALNVNTNSEVLWGIRKLEVALALDNTGSMASSSKMTNLKTAAHNLLTTLKNAARKNGDVKVAIIPFDTTVNIGTSYKDNDWFDYDSIDCNGSQSGQGCTSSTWKDYWEGCVRDRTYPFDTQDNPPTGANTSTYFPAHDCGSLAKMMPLSFDWTALNSKIDAMTPNGNTNVTIGLVWAWHAADRRRLRCRKRRRRAPDLDKVIILLTDGDNTESWKNSNNSKVTSQSTIDARTQVRLQQHQGRQYQALHDPRHQRRRTLLQELRDQPEHVLRRPAGQPAQRRIRRDRAKSRQPAHRQMRRSSRRPAAAGLRLLALAPSSRRRSTRCDRPQGPGRAEWLVER